MTILCNLQNINLTFGDKEIFKNAQISINKGDQIGLIGLNGHGKSTLFKILTDQIIPDISKPSFLFDKSNEHFSVFIVPQELPVKEFSDLNVKNFYLAFYPSLYELNKKIGDVEEKMASGDYSEKTLHLHEKLLHEFDVNKGWQIQNSYESYLKLFELNSSETKVSKLSGGEQKKMALSAGLSATEELILWDEPTNHLDIDTIELFEDELKNSSKTFIVISHDRYLLNHVSKQIFHIDNSQINQFSGNYLEYLEYLEQKEEERLKQLNRLQNHHRRELAWMRQGIKARGTRSKKRVEGFHNIEKEISTLRGNAKKQLDLDMQHSGRKTKKLIAIEDGEFGYKTPILKDINLGIYKKDKIAIVGKNGTGKTTLINLLCGNIHLNSGKHYIADGLKYVIFDQKRATLDESKTPKEVVGDGRDHVITADGTQKHIHSYLEKFLFKDNQINRPISSLSGGEKNRLQLAMFMLNQADVWIFDEPTNDLDIETIELLEAQLKAYDQAVIIIGHDRAFLENIVDQTWFVHDKNIEIFTAGISQVTDYMQALKMASNQVVKKEIPKQQKNEKLKMSNKEKMRWKVIEQEIADTEEQLESIQVKLANFDFSNLSTTTNADYEALNLESKNTESKLEKLYEEWEDLSNKKGE